MNARLNGWWRKWGLWVGPTTMLAVLALFGRMEACITAKAGEAEYAEHSRGKIEALEKRQDGTDRWIEEHKMVATSRIAQLDTLDRNMAIVQKGLEGMEADLKEIKEDLRELRRARGLRP